MTKDKAGNEVEVTPIIAQPILAKIREKKAKSTLFMAILDEHLARFYGIKDAKTLWAAIKTRFGGNAESKKMQKNVLKQQFEKKFVSNSEGLYKGYDRFQRLLSLLEIHKAGVSTKDANQNFLRSLPSAWNNISLIMRNKPGIDTLEIDDMYNNLKVSEADIKSSSGSSSNSQNVAFVSIESISSTNELNAAYSVFTTTCHSSQAQEEGSLPGIADQPEIKGTRVEMLGMHDTKEVIIIKGLQKRMMNKHCKNTISSIKFISAANAFYRDKSHILVSMPGLFLIIKDILFQAEGRDLRKF
nr:ribonuclease H-like domain-containing protein [Tanacetum cinerariifolium]